MENSINLAFFAEDSTGYFGNRGIGYKSRVFEVGYTIFLCIFSIAVLDRVKNFENLIFCLMLYCIPKVKIRF